MEGNPICVQIPWDKNPEAIAKWANVSKFRRRKWKSSQNKTEFPQGKIYFKHFYIEMQGQTGFPWIDAIMTQLREEGWIHHLARHAVACFLTRGDLWVSWEEGMKIFDELLLDADWSVNAGMWMWLSCSSFFQQFFHCYCPVRFGRKADPNGDYIRRYLPILKVDLTKSWHYFTYKTFDEFAEFPNTIYPRAVECTRKCTKSSQMYYWKGVLIADGKSCGCEQNKYGKNETSLSSAL